jgi:hypothetical protein
MRALRLYPEDVSWHVDPQPFAARWHAIGLAAYLSMLAIYAVAGIYVDGAGVDPRLYKVLVAVALLGLVVALIGRGRGWQEQRVLLVGCRWRRLLPRPWSEPSSPTPPGTCPARSRSRSSTSG